MNLNPKFDVPIKKDKSPEWEKPVTQEQLLSYMENYDIDAPDVHKHSYLINTHYSDLQDELDVWYGELTFSQLAIVHEIEEQPMYEGTNEQTQAMLDELEEEWVEMSTDTKVMWYKQIMGY